jgi:hypothetical protein
MDKIMAKGESIQSLKTARQLLVESLDRLNVVSDKVESIYLSLKEELPSKSDKENQVDFDYASLALPDALYRINDDFNKHMRLIEENIEEIKSIIG